MPSAPPAGVRNGSSRSESHQQLLLHSGYRSMNTKLALSAVVAALMLTACAKQESAGTGPAAAPPAPASDQAAADAKAAADSAAQQTGQAAGAAADAAKPAEGAAPPPAENPPPKQ